MMTLCETYCVSRHAAAAPLISADSRISRIGRVVNFRNGVHGAIVFARSDTLLASINATPPHPHPRNRRRPEIVLGQVAIWRIAATTVSGQFLNCQ